jgi:hypothetical protein
VTALYNIAAREKALNAVERAQRALQAGISSRFPVHLRVDVRLLSFL